MFIYVYVSGRDFHIAMRREPTSTSPQQKKMTVGMENEKKKYAYYLHMWISFFSNFLF